MHIQELILVCEANLLRRLFLKGYKNTKIAYDVLNKKPTTLNEAFEMVTFQEHNFKAQLAVLMNYLNVTTLTVFVG